MEVARKIQEVRKKSGLTQKEFADKLFVSRQAVTRWESGGTTPTIDTLKAITHLFKIDTCELLGTVCQSCAMKMNDPADFGLNKDKSVNGNYCSHCMVDGELSPVGTLDEMLEICAKYLDNPTDDAKTRLRAQLSKLRRWREEEK